MLASFSQISFQKGNSSVINSNLYPICHRIAWLQISETVKVTSVSVNSFFCSEEWSVFSLCVNIEHGVRNCRLIFLNKVVLFLA